LHVAGQPQVEVHEDVLRHAHGHPDGSTTSCPVTFMTSIADSGTDVHRGQNSIANRFFATLTTAAWISAVHVPTRVSSTTTAAWISAILVPTCISTTTRATVWTVAWNTTTM
jgi:hypothetical protein